MFLNILSFSICKALTDSIIREILNNYNRQHIPGSPGVRVPDAQARHRVCRAIRLRDHPPGRGPARDGPLPAAVPGPLQPDGPPTRLLHPAAHLPDPAVGGGHQDAPAEDTQGGHQCQTPVRLIINY